MTMYHIHLYRVMRLYFPCIEACTPEEAARIAADRPTQEAFDTEDCDGDNLAALIEVAGDNEFTQSVTIDFEPERLRKAVPELLDALVQTNAMLHMLWDLIADSPDEDTIRTDINAQLAVNSTAITKATANQADRRPA